MFTNAFAKASQFTLPVVISSRLGGGECSSAIGACVAVNREGWILTAAHLIKEIERQRESVLKHRDHQSDIRRFENDTAADKFFRKQGVRTFHTPSKSAVKNHSVWWGKDGAQLRDLAVINGADLALGRLEPFDPDWVAHYPVFKKPDASYLPGRSLCKFGFPFHKITPTFDTENNSFVLPKGAVPLPLFPIEGMFTRVVIAAMPGAKEGENGKFIETSSPGLVGQSGGPIVDSEGVVWALQSHTRHYPLGFSPPIPGQSESPAQKEHQFLNVGLGVHAEIILNFLKQRGVEHQVAD